MLSVTPYILDLTASDRANFVDSKSHTMIRSANGTQLLLIECGCFYETGLKIVDTATNKTLTVSQYRLGGFMKAVSDMSADRAWRYLVITDAAISSTVLVSCQAVGGVYSMTSKTLEAALGELDDQTDPINWLTDVTDKPLLYTPSEHDEYSFQLYGLEYITDELEKIRQSVKRGDRAMWDDAYNRINTVKNLLSTIDKASEDALNAHIADMNNPHNNTYGQIGAFGKADLDALREQLVLQAYNTIYVPLVQTNNPSVNGLTAALQAHINQGAGAHNLTLDQVGAAPASSANVFESNAWAYTDALNALMNNYLWRDGPSSMDNGGFGAYWDTSHTAYLYSRIEPNGFVVIGLCLGDQYESGNNANFRIEFNTGSYTLYFYLLGSEILKMTSADRIMKISDVEALIAQANCKCDCDW